MDSQKRTRSGIVVMAHTSWIMNDIGLLGMSKEENTFLTERSVLFSDSVTVLEARSIKRYTGRLSINVFFPTDIIDIRNQ